MISTKNLNQTMGWMFARVTFVPTLVFNVAMERLSSRKWFNNIDEKVILGALPFRSMTKQLVDDERVRGVVSMNESYELKFLSNMTKEWGLAGCKFLQLSTTDMFEVPTPEKLKTGVDFINSIDDGLVYVHCKAGRTRSATLVACYLMHKNGWTPEMAIEHMKERRPHIYLGPRQLQAINNFHQSINL